MSSDQGRQYVRELERKLQEDAAERKAQGIPLGSFSQNRLDVGYKLVILGVGVVILILVLAILSLTSTSTPGAGPGFLIATSAGA